MGTKTPFGRLSLITVGYLFQLKSVFDKWIFKSCSSDFYSALATNMWREYFTLFELTEIMRQKDDKIFAELINRLREGNHCQNDIEVLKERVLKTKPGDKNYPFSKTHLFSTNALVNNHNTTIYHASQTDKAQIKCIDIVVGDMSDDLKK